MAIKIRFNSLKTRLIIVLLLIVILPTLTIGWLAYNMMSDYIRTDRISDVGRVADNKHEQLVMVLTRATLRAEHFLSDLSAQCGGNTAKLNHICATDLIKAYQVSEGAVGANLHRKGRGDSLTIGTSAVQNEEGVTFQSGQLAKFSSTGPNSNHAYFISIEEASTGLRLSVTYPRSVLEAVFNPPPADVGLSGETFLADGEGYFVTQPRYTSTQGHGIPIFALPMQACLSGQNHEVLDQDYRDAAIIHGFRFIPEFGSACIMAHTTQEEAFAPLKSLEQRLIYSTLLFCLFLIITIIYLARNIVKPIVKLTEVTRSITAGDYKAQAEEAGQDEISDLAISFNLMAKRLAQSENTLNEAQQLAHIGSWERDLMMDSLTCSDEVFCIFEIAPPHKDMSYETFISTVHPDDREMVDRAYLTCIQTREPFDLEHRLLLAKGQVKWVNEHGTFYYDASGVPLRSVGTIQDVTARKKAEENLNHLAFYDPLTNLPNRRLLHDRLQQAKAASARSGKYGAILFIDLDKFKVVNDTKGRDSGDLLLIEVAQRLQSCVREGDTVARIGGDEFVVALEDMKSEVKHAAAQAEEIGEKILAALNRPYLIKTQELRSTASIGISLYVDHSATSDALLQNADIAMCQAKASGQNALRFFDPDMQAVLEVRTAIETDLHRALVERQFTLYYQAQVDDAGRIFGAEALVRWIHPQRGTVPPVKFIPIAEESSLILDIGQWVLETACQQLALWNNDEQKCNLKLAVNVSAKQFKLKDFVNRVAAVIKAHRFNPSCLKLELTESVVMDDVADIVAKMYALKALGVSLSLDDFGTGYSSLSYLKQLPLDQLKIDKSFVNDITTDPIDAIMVRTIIDMAHNFRLNVIAEGVETDAQLAFLKEHGCMSYQGYLFSKPVPIAEFEALLKLT